MDGETQSDGSSRTAHGANTLEVESVPLASLVLDPANTRTHDARNIDAIKASLATFGQQKPIVIDATNRIVAGNGTATAAKALGWADIAVVRTNLNGAEAIAFAIADNRTAELAEWDDGALAATLAALQNDPTVDFAATGFSEEEIRELCSRANGTVDGLVDPDDIPLPPDEAITKPGDLWVLGNHRLLCGDSSKPEDVDRLLDGQPVHLINTDPPYNVKVEPRSNNAIAAGLSSFQATNAKPMTHHQTGDLARHPEKSQATHRKLRAKDRPLANDFVSDEDFDHMLDAWFGNMARVLVPGGSFYIWGGYANLGNYPPFLKKHKLYFSQGIVWDKEHPVLTRKDFMGAFELCFYGWREGAGHQYYGPNNATDLWHVKKVNPQSMIHLTEKPVELAMRAIQNSSLTAHNVLDLFGGSGSTLIACEQTGRRAFLMELDELYCDVIVQRWEKFTGRKAERVAAETVQVRTPAPIGTGAEEGQS
jgi:DNA modification methylase